VLDAAEETRSPIIIGFSGDFLTRPGRRTSEKIGWYGALGRAAAESASVPCGLIFNECPNVDGVRQAISLGFNLVMLANEPWSFEEYTRQVAGLVAAAHQKGVAFEAEIGELPVGASGEVVTDHSSSTDPDQAACFVAATGVDLLSISIGNIHVLMEGQRDLDLERLDRIRQKVSIPLGLHGGSGISTSSLRQAIGLGITKVNYGTYVKQHYLAVVRRALESHANPHELLGMGGAEDVLVAGRLAVREAVLERLDILGCCGQAA
jgi:fructose/tagatose bisphosphate aldolase